MKIELTEEILKSIRPGEIFAKGDGMLPVANYPLKWVAIRGEGYHDWAIYYGYNEIPDSEIARIGCKMFTKEVIRELVPCNNKAWSLYRF